MDLNRKRSKIFYGWYIVAANSIIIILTGGVTLGFTAVFEPITEEFGWSYTQVALAASLRGLEMSLLAPLTGSLADRWGPKRLIFIGGILICLGFLLLSRVTSLATFYAAFVLISIGMSTCSPTVLLTAIANWFHRRAGLVTGIVTSGFGLGGLMVPVITKLIDILRWRMAMVTVGLSTLSIVLPLSLIVRHKPEDYGYRPDGELTSPPKTGNTQTSTVSSEVSTSARRALRKRAFWQVAIAGMCQAFVVSAIVTHIMPYLSSLGIERSTSSFIALTIPVASICGRLSSDWLCDRVGRNQIFGAAFALMTTGLLLFSYATSSNMWLLVPFVITFSLGWGLSVTTRISLIREYFGRSSFGSILGFTMGIMMMGNMAGAPLAGWVYDNWQSYQGAWLSFSGITFVAMVLALTIPQKTKPVGGILPLPLY